MMHDIIVYLLIGLAIALFMETALFDRLFNINPDEVTRIKRPTYIAMQAAAIALWPLTVFLLVLFLVLGMRDPKNRP